MAKYSEKLVDKIVSLIEEDAYTITDICAILNISRKTFYGWRESKPEFDKAVEEATEAREEKLLVKARESLKKKLEGYTLTETKLKYIPDEEDPTQLKLKEKIVKIKEYAPDNGAIKIVLDRKQVAKVNCTDEKRDNGIMNITVLDLETKNQLELLQQRLKTTSNFVRKEEVPIMEAKNLRDSSHTLRMTEEKLQIKTG